MEGDGEGQVFCKCRRAHVGRGEAVMILHPNVLSITLSSVELCLITLALRQPTLSLVTVALMLPCK